MTVLDILLTFLVILCIPMVYICYIIFGIQIGFLFDRYKKYKLITKKK